MDRGLFGLTSKLTAGVVVFRAVNEGSRRRPANRPGHSKCGKGIRKPEASCRNEARTRTPSPCATSSPSSQPWWWAPPAHKPSARMPSTAACSTQPAHPCRAATSKRTPTLALPTRSRAPIAQSHVAHARPSARRRASTPPTETATTEAPAPSMAPLASTAPTAPTAARARRARPRPLPPRGGSFGARRLARSSRHGAAMVRATTVVRAPSSETARSVMIAPIAAPAT
jgi:hypothetical protein